MSPYIFIIGVFASMGLIVLGRFLMYKRSGTVPNITAWALPISLLLVAAVAAAIALYEREGWTAGFWLFWSGLVLLFVLLYRHDRGLFKKPARKRSTET